MNLYLFIILFLLFIEYFLNTLGNILNIKSINQNQDMPLEFKDLYDIDKYNKSRDYIKENIFFKIFKDTFFLILILLFIFKDFFVFLDFFVRRLSDSNIIRGLIFSGIIFFAFELLNIPFSFYHTFVIEEKYGFNRTKLKTFILDLVKSWILSIIIGGVLLTILIFLFEKFNRLAWLYCWIATSLFEVFLVFVAPVLILPLFNKFMPIQDKELTDLIYNYAKRQNFPIKSIFKIDASRRSAKTNAFFVGFSKFRRIGLFDTLLKSHTKEEILTILAHEVGHYKKKHFVKDLFISIFNIGFLFFIFYFFVYNKNFFSAFKVEPSIYSSFALFSLIYSPINFLLSIFYNAISRKHEYEADLFAIRTTNMPDNFILALKKLSIENFSNLTPHRFKVVLEYSHPPILERINFIRSLSLEGHRI